MRSWVANSATPPMPATPVARDNTPSRGEDSLFRRAIRTLFGGAEEGERGFSGSVEGLRERGVVRVNDARRLVVSFMLSGAYDWSPPTRVVLELVDGQKIEVEVEVKSSTQAEPLTAGSRVRLVMNLERALPGALINIYLPTTPEGVIEIVA